MKISRKTKIRIRRIVAFIRTMSIYLCLLFIGLAIASADGPSIVLFLVFIGLSTLCFGIAAVLDELLWQTAWSGDKSAF